MGLHCCLPIFLLLTWLVGGLNAGLAHAEEAVEWLRGAGKDLEIRLAGEVLDADGRPAVGVTVSGQLNHQVSPLPLEPKVDGHRFEAWIPVNRTHWYSMWLTARSKEGDSADCLSLNGFQLRQAAIEGVKLTLRPPTRQVEVLVTHRGGPVRNAHVQANAGYGIELKSRTDAKGVARIAIPASQNISRLMAWTDDRRIGGFSFNRKPTRDPNAASHKIELSDCVDRTFRFVDEEGLPVPGVDFILQLATAPPDYNFIGTNEHSRMTSDANGEAVYRWFPDWQKNHLYVDIDSTEYFVEGNPQMRRDDIIFKLRRCTPRKTISGRVELAEDAAETGLGGFYVRLDTFQAEREGYTDQLWAYTDHDGVFALDVLPGATYCGYALDERWVGELIDLIPYQPAIDRVTPPVLKVFAGEPVEVVVTKGAEKKPYSDLTVSFRRYHHYQWIENGKPQGGMGGPQWWAVTDEQGIARTRTAPGKLEVSVYTPLWRTEKEVQVADGKPTTVELHREIEENRTVTGRLVLSKGIEGTLDGAMVAVGAVDGDYNFEQTLKAGKDGAFKVETVARQLGVLARTADGSAAGFSVAKELDKPIEVTLRPTLAFHGMVVDDNDRPVTNHKLNATVRVEGTEKENEFFLASFDALRLSTTTDDLGTFSFAGLPTNVRVLFSAEPLAGSNDSHYLGDAYLEPNDSRAPGVFHIKVEEKPAPAAKLSERYEKALRDARLGGYHVMVILSTPADDVAEFVDNNFVDYRQNPDVAAYMQLIVHPSQVDQEAADMLFLEERDWPLPENGRVLAVALDSSGEELGRLEVDVSDKDAAEQAAAFVRRHAPAKADAKKKWDEAFAEARSSHRRVWARVSQRYCGPCFMLARWLDEHQEVLAKDYVMLKIDDVRDAHGGEVAKRLTRGGAHGVPFHVIFDAEEKPLIDSAGPLGNIGYPSGVEGKRHLRKMLMETRRNLTEDEIERLVGSFEE